MTPRLAASFDLGGAVTSRFELRSPRSAMARAAAALITAAAAGPPARRKRRDPYADDSETALVTVSMSLDESRALVLACKYCGLEKSTLVRRALTAYFEAMTEALR